MSLLKLVATANAVRDTASRLEKRDRIAAYLRTLSPGEAHLGAQYLAGEFPQGKLHIGWRTLVRAMGAPEVPQQTLFDEGQESAPLLLVDVDRFLARLASVAGQRATERRLSILTELMSRADSVEREYLRRLVGGELRQGARRALVIEGVAQAYGVDTQSLRRAVMVSGDFGAVVRALAAVGEKAIESFDIAPLKPVEPMLASAAEDVGVAAIALGRAAIEWKLDGLRVQVHRAGEDVRVFSRRLRDITSSVPELVDVARSLASTRFIIDGEVIGRDRHGKPVPFQRLMSVISREVGSTAEHRDVRIEALFFDVLCLGDEVMVERPYRERAAALDRLLPPAYRMPRRVVSTAEEARAVYDEAIASGHEGVVLKDLEASYRAGRRGAHWQKVKPAITVDLVILAAEWGSGRRTGWLSNLHLGAPVHGDPERFVMLGKTFKGLTDDMLAYLTRDLPIIETHRDEFTVYVQPRRVAEIAFDGLQRSSRYDSGLALRFARVKRFRPDKRADEATTIEEIRAIYDRQHA